jgi:hypothetical protein
MLERADTAEAIGLNQRASALLDQFLPLQIGPALKTGLILFATQ